MSSVTISLRPDQIRTIIIQVANTDLAMLKKVVQAAEDAATDKQFEEAIESIFTEHHNVFGTLAE